MSPHDEPEDFRTANSPQSNAASAGEGTTPKVFGGLTAFPTGPDQKSELPPPESAALEMTVGALWGAGLGAVLGGVFGLAVGVLFGILIGKWVAFAFGGAGQFTVRSVAVGVFRVPFLAFKSLRHPYRMSVRLTDRDRENR
jgi:hypothetical protein